LHKFGDSISGIIEVVFWCSWFTLANIGPAYETIFGESFLFTGKSDKAGGNTATILRSKQTL